MKPLDERLNDQLEQLVQSSGRQVGGFTRPAPEREHVPEFDDLVDLAQFLQCTPQVQITPDFAGQLERRLLRRHAELRLQQGSKRRSFFALLRARPVVSTILGFCVLFCLVSTSLLALAAQVSNPTNPLYAIKQWERQVQGQFSGNPADQAALHLQSARDRLNTLAGLANPAHEGTYRQALLDLDQQINAATVAINGLPVGSQRNQLVGELANLKSDAIHVLRGLLARLSLSERLATTDELRRLGDTAPILTNATLSLPAHPNGRATIRLEGSHIQAGAQLLVNGKIIEASETLQQGQVVFVAEWKGDQHPQSLGILNPDGTVAQTTTITITGATNSNQSGNGNQNGNGNKPSSTPTPHGNKPTTTPTPHH